MSMSKEMNVKLIQAKADEWREAFPDGRIPVTSLRMDYEPVDQVFYWHINVSALTDAQKAYLCKVARARGTPDTFSNEEILSVASIKQQDGCCLQCGTEGKHNCQAPNDVYEQWQESEEDDWDEDEFGEQPPFFANMPWISDNLGSMLEHQLTQYKEPNQCRQCGKLDEALRSKKVEERFCSEQCSKEWHGLMEMRITQGEYDLRTRGYD